MSDPIPGRCVGLIGGLGVGAAIHYYRELAEAHTARRRVMNLVMAHADVDRVLAAVGAGDKHRLAKYLAELIARLASAGAEFAVIPAVAPHIAIAELTEISPLPLVSMIQEVKHEIERRGLRRVAIFGTRFAVESQLFGHLRHLDVIPPRPEELDYIHSTYAEIVNSGIGQEHQRQGFSRLAHTLIQRGGVEAIILAGTDLALIFDKSTIDFPHIDCARLQLNAIMNRALDSNL